MDSSFSLDERRRAVKAFRQVMGAWLDLEQNCLSDYMFDPPRIKEEAMRWEAREKLINFSIEIQQIAAGPTQILQQLMISVQQAFCLNWLCANGVLNDIPLAGGISYDLLAERNKVPRSTLVRVVRMMASLKFLRELPHGRVEHTDASSLFSEDHELQAQAMSLFQSTIPAAIGFHDAIPHEASNDKTSSVGETASITGDAIQEASSDDTSETPEIVIIAEVYTQELCSKDISQAMAIRTREASAQLATRFHPRLTPNHLCAILDEVWVVANKVVDVGGGTGHISIGLAQQYPNVNFIIQDLPEVISSIDDLSPEDLPAGISLQAHDFFEPQPQTDADVYLLHMVLHEFDWDRASEILRQLRKAMTNDARIIIVDVMLSTNGGRAAGCYADAITRARDLAMLQTTGGREYEREDWDSLVEAEGLCIANVWYPEGADVAVMEVLTREFYGTKW